MSERLSLYGEGKGDDAQYALHLHLVEFDGGHSWNVWLNSDHDFDGLCVGAGLTQADAISDAIDTLEIAVARLKGLT